MNERWYDKTVAQVEEKLNTDASTGLSLNVLRTRQKNDRLNVIFPFIQHSFEECFKKAVSEPTTIILFIVAVISAFLERRVESLVILSLIAFNIFLSVFSYKKSYQIFEDMGKLAMPTVKVMRNGKLFLVKSEQLVVGDVIYLSAGDMVPADARLVECDNLQVLEVNVTSEIKPVEKDPYFLRYNRDIPAAQQANMVFASTIVIKGSAKAICCCTGEDTLVCKLKRNKHLVHHDEIKAISFTKKYSKIWSLCMILLTFVVFILRLIFNQADDSLFSIFLSAVSLAAVTSGEFHVLSSYVIVADGLFSAVKQNKHLNSGALIKNISKTENLKDITCLIVHKEGAFSVKDVKVEKVYVNSTIYTDGEVNFTKNAKRPLRFALISTGLYGAGKIVKNNLNNDNIYTSDEDAIITIAQKCKVYNINLDKNYPILEHVPQGQSSKFETTLVDSAKGYTVACRGDLFSILSVCDKYHENGKIYQFTPDKKSDIISEALRLSRKSYKIIGIASKNTHYNNLRRIISCQSDMVFEGFIAIKERMLPGAVKNIADCQAAGIKIIMLCDDFGDHNKTLAESLGVVKNKEEIITGRELDKLKDEIFRTNVSMYKLYQDVSIYQKRKLLSFLKEEGEIVGVLARELDEIILLKEADVGIVQSTTLSGKLDKTGLDMAMAKNTNSPLLVKNTKNVNKTGSEALKFIADVIISDADKRGNGGFNAIVNAIVASKAIYRNLAKFVKYLLTVQTARVFITLFTIFTKSNIFDARQVLFTGFVIDFISMIIFAFEQSDNRTLFKKDSSEELLNIYKAVPLAVISGFVLAGFTVLIPLFLNLFGINDIYVHSTVVFFSFIFSQIVVMNEIIKDGSIFKTSLSFNRAHIIMAMMTIMFIGICLLSTEFGLMFGVVRPGWISMALSVVPAVIMLIVYEIQKLIINNK